VIQTEHLNVLHVTAHLGGGVGRALSRVAAYQGASARHVHRTILCLERTEKEAAPDLIRQAGVPIVQSPSPKESAQLLKAADIVQLEWWHHPLMAGWLSRSASQIPARWVVWSHTSGFHYPAFPSRFIGAAHAFLFTTPVSHRLWDPRLKGEGPEGPVVDDVPSSGGFEDVPAEKQPAEFDLRFGYLGSLNFAKLHPEIVRYLAAVDLPEFAVDFHGDDVNPRLSEMAVAAGIPERVRIMGYSNRPRDVLSRMDVLVYLLNPCHYGTTENALLEAMANSTVPVVLNNPVESSIVTNGITGLVVDSPQGFADAVIYLNDHPEERRRLGAAARKDVTERYSLESTIAKLEKCYSRVAGAETQEVNFGDIFGRSPAEWFMSCLGNYAAFFSDRSGLDQRAVRLSHPVLYERSKSSAFHFLRYYPDDPQLITWASMLEADLAAA
jgi:L-malate glycosyltransferase